MAAEGAPSAPPYYASHVEGHPNMWPAPRRTEHATYPEVVQYVEMSLPPPHPSVSVVASEASTRSAAARDVDDRAPADRGDGDDVGRRPSHSRLRADNAAGAAARPRSLSRPSLNYFRVDTVALYFSLFLTTALTLVPSIFYAQHPDCPHSAFEIEAFLVALSSALSGTLVVLSSLSHRRLALHVAAPLGCRLHGGNCENGDSAQVLYDRSRRKVKRSAALSVAAFTLCGFSSGTATGVVLTYYLHGVGAEQGCPREYADVIVAGSLVLICSMVLTGVHQGIRYLIRWRDRRRRE